MEQTNPMQTEETPTGNQELIRPLQGRMIAGVAQGLANRFDIPVGLLRFLFVLTAFFGGLGVLLYAAGWVLIRSENEPEAPVERFFAEPSTARSWIGIGLILWAALIILGNLTFLRDEFVWGVGLLVVGVLLYTGQIPLRVSKREKAEDEPDEPDEPDAEMESPPMTTEAPTRQEPAEPPTGGGPPPVPTPTPPALPPAAKPRERSVLGRITIGLALLAMGVLALLDSLPGVPIEASPRHYLALVVTVLGLGLLVGSVVGRARWLILIALLLIPPLFFSPIFEFDITSSSFSQEVAPTDFADLEWAYSVEVGNLVIDLTRLPWDGRTVDLDASVDAGNLLIRIPEGVGIVGTAEIDVGRISVLGRENSGIGLRSFDFDESGELGTVRLQASVDVGNIEITKTR